VANFRLFDARCTLQTWVYRVAHNVAASHITRQRRVAARLVDLDALEAEPGFIDGEAHANQRYSVSRLFDRIYLLKPLDRQIILLYLEGEAAASIAEVTGLSAVNVATKIHRLKRLLSRESGEGVIHAAG
jgi:RNA polymerase sigma-70 factor (ECF subfamily)